MRTAIRLSCELALSVTLVFAVLLSIPGIANAGQTQRDEVARAVAAQTGGRVLSVEATDSARGDIWRVKVLAPSGDVFVVEVPRHPAFTADPRRRPGF